MARKEDQALSKTPSKKSGPQGDTPGTEEDGGETILSGRSREQHPGIPEQAENPEEDQNTRQPKSTEKGKT